MRTIECNQSTFHCDSDVFGDVIIYSKSAESVTVPFADILHFVAEHIRSKRIQKLEAMSSDELIQSLI